MVSADRGWANFSLIRLKFGSISIFFRKKSTKKNIFIVKESKFPFFGCPKGGGAGEETGPV
jgi:hypothetical protein